MAASLKLAAAVVYRAELNRERIAARLEDGFLDATALMEYLIRKGVPMRSGHEIVGRLVSECEQRGLRLKQLPLAEIQKVCDKVDASVFDVLGATHASDALISYGGGGKTRVSEQLKLWQQRLGD